MERKRKKNGKIRKESDDEDDFRLKEKTNMT